MATRSKRTRNFVAKTMTVKSPKTRNSERLQVCTGGVDDDEVEKSDSFASRDKKNKEHSSKDVQTTRKSGRKRGNHGNGQRVESSKSMKVQKSDKSGAAVSSPAPGESRDRNRNEAARHAGQNDGAASEKAVSMSNSRSRLPASSKEPKIADSATDSEERPASATAGKHLDVPLRDPGSARIARELRSSRSKQKRSCSETRAVSDDVQAAACSDDAASVPVPTSETPKVASLVRATGRISSTSRHNNSTMATAKPTHERSSPKVQCSIPNIMQKTDASIHADRTPGSDRGPVAIQSGLPEFSTKVISTHTVPAPSPKPRSRRTRSSNRPKTDPEVFTSMEIKLTLSPDLTRWLYLDFFNVNVAKKLLMLPARVTVDQVVEDFVHSQAANPRLTNMQAVVAGGITETFNAVLGTRLLFPSERQQHRKIKTNFPDKVPSSVYGPVHLLRIFSKAESFLESSLSENNVHCILGLLMEFIRFLTARKDHLFSTDDYYTPAPEQ